MKREKEKVIGSLINNNQDKKTLLDPTRLMVTMLVLMLGLSIAVISHLFFSAYLTPTVLVPLLLSVLLGHAVGYAGIIPAAILGAGLAAGHNRI